MTTITIIIPTHNRQTYAAAAVAKIASVLPQAQIVVSDTSADDGLRTMLSGQVPAGIELAYMRPGRKMDVVSHFEFALSHATGDYVMFLGDDDCVGPGLTDVAEWAARNRVDAVFSYGTKFIANYFWPGVRSRFYGDGYAGSLFVHRFDGAARRIDPIAALQEALRDLGRGLGTMPRLYHGLVARTLIERVRARFGTVFGGVTPDIYSAALISALAENAWQVDYPFCLPGGSPSSTAGTGAAGTDLTSLVAHPHTAAFDNLQWDPVIPAFYAPYNVWAFSLKKAVDRIDRADLRPNLARLYAVALINNREQRKRIYAASRNAGQLGIGTGKIVIEGAYELSFQARRIGARLLKPRAGGGAIHYRDLPTIDAGYDRLERHIADNGIRLTLPDLTA
ncbi:glycosyltransferase [Sphingomonas sp. Y38-1Y]|uniref:glycosyltransferase n=1 Tax=Sphingomonas sp. Y38-1Y TaxID=3078265 RepID=UPI0028E26ED3|nr:glycosyltransferase [Sphingomonas sp. Y38-1Y]